MDGVLTDGSLLVMPDGEWVRRMNIKDGYALQLAVRKGYNVWVITGSSSVPVEKRLNRLGISMVFQQVKDQLPLLDKLKGNME
jgi:3-deoxy-D-manno-octulosonate 8-phosphate phosphatase (KDO 8-P phosphatase)